MNCPNCESIQNNAHIIYKDNAAVAQLVEKPAMVGHSIVLPIEHQPIIEKLSDEIFEDMFVMANKIAIAGFEVLGAHGTNILINNGLPAGQTSGHTQINIIPRFEGDGLNVQWNPTKATEDDLNDAMLRLNSELMKKEEEPKKEEEKKVEVQEAEEELADEDNYLLKQLERQP